MRNLLYLVHRLPYPPNKGDKITSFNMLKYLSKDFNIFMACFVDDKNDWKYIDEVKKHCKETCIVGLNPTISKIKSLVGLTKNKALSVCYYQNSKMTKWVDVIISKHKIDSVLIFSGVMAQYVSEKLSSDTVTVLDLEDVDSDKWRQYSEEHKWPMSWLYLRESKYLLAYEARMAKEFDSTVLVSKEEATFFKKLVPEVTKKIEYRVQGVDSKFFDPYINYPEYYKKNDKVFVFIGAMDYWPNADAAIWFGKSIVPEIRKLYSDFKFYVVGMNPQNEVKELENIEGITVTGGVKDVRPYLAHAMAAILPLRVARGIQNKVLEAMAMQKPVIATSNAMQGIKSCPGYKPLIADDEKMLINAVKEIIEQLPNNDMLKQGRKCILEKYNWDTNLQKIKVLLTSK